MSKELALVKEDTVDVVMDRVREFQSNGEIDLPSNYSVENAMKSAWLELQRTKTKNKQPVLKACSKNSIANALLDMVVQGLNPSKEQCYFVAYGDQLVCMRSYFGSKALVKQVANAEDVVAQAIYKGDDIDYTIEDGVTKITKHEQDFQNKLNGTVVGAYATIKFKDERPDYTEIMTIDQLKQSWSQGQTYKENGNGTHQKFDEEMAKKTASNRVCKQYINSSDDSGMLDESANRSSIVQAEQEANEEIEENANSTVIDIEESAPEEENAEENNEENVQEEQELKDTGTDGKRQGPEF